MNTDNFFGYFMDKQNIIKDGIQATEFSVDVPFDKLVKKVTEAYEFNLTPCQQSGIPVGKDAEAKKKSFCIDFDKRCNNLLTIFNFEIVKYILYKIDVKVLLTKLLNEIKNDEVIVNSNNHDIFKANVKLWIRIFNSSKLQIVPEFTTWLKETKFYNFHKSVIVTDIFKDILSDIKKVNNNIEHIDLRKTIIEIFEKLIEFGKVPNSIEINTLDDLIINVEHLDVVYEGSFLKRAKDLHESNPLTNKYIMDFISKYNIGREIDGEVKPALMEKNFVILINYINKIYPNISIEFSQEFIENLTDILIDFFISLIDKILVIYENIALFDHAFRFHFKTIMMAIQFNLAKYEHFQPSQLTLLHYALLLPSDIEKSFGIIEKKIFGKQQSTDDS